MLAGRLGYNADTQPWLRFMISSMYVSLAHALGSSRAHLVKSDKNFCALLKHMRSDLRFHRFRDGSSGAHGKPARTDDSKQEHGCALSQISKRIHRSRKRFQMNRTLRREIRLVYRALQSKWIDPWRPLGHMVPQDPNAAAWSDSSLHAAGGFSYDMGFWWYIKRPQDIAQRTLGSCRRTRVASFSQSTHWSTRP